MEWTGKWRVENGALSVESRVQCVKRVERGDWSGIGRNASNNLSAKHGHSRNATSNNSRHSNSLGSGNNEAGQAGKSRRGEQPPPLSSGTWTRMRGIVCLLENKRSWQVCSPVTPHFAKDGQEL